MHTTHTLHTHSTEQVAIKVIDKLKLDDHSRRLLSNEVVCMEQLDHPNILSLFEVIDTFHKVYIVTEFARGGDLQQRVNGQGPMGEEDGKIIFVQLVSAVEHMVRDLCVCVGLCVCVCACTLYVGCGCVHVCGVWVCVSVWGMGVCLCGV